MSKTWDEKYARNKDKAKDAFGEAAPKREPDFSEVMKRALDDMKDRRQALKIAARKMRMPWRKMLNEARHKSHRSIRRWRS